MKSLLEDNSDTITFLEDNIFPNIYNGNTILFLGAGFSVTDKKKYLGKEIINFYQEKLKVDLETNDLVEFVDTIYNHAHNFWCIKIAIFKNRIYCIQYISF